MKKMIHRLRHLLTHEGVRPHHHASRMDRTGKAMEIIGLVAIALGIISIALTWYASHISSAIKDLFASLLK